MELTIKLKNSYGRLATREPFVITTAEDERYFLNLDGDVRLYNLVAVFRMGDLVKEVKYPGGVPRGLNEVKQVEVPAEFVREGLLEVEIHVISHGFVSAKYHVEPIVFSRVDTHFTGCPEFEELKALVKKQTEIIKFQSEVIDGLNERLKLTEAQVREIWEYEEQ